MMNIRTYSELSKIMTFEERFEYLKLDGEVGVETFGFDRYLNQEFYHSREWRRIRDIVIIRDNGCDLGLDGYSINGKIIIHHINPIKKFDIYSLNSVILNPEYLVCTSFETHNAIHYGDKNLLQKEPMERYLNDTCPWKK